MSDDLSIGGLLRMTAGDSADRIDALEAALAALPDSAPR